MDMLALHAYISTFQPSRRATVTQRGKEERPVQVQVQGQRQGQGMMTE
jgi:hypothetical protein